MRIEKLKNRTAAYGLGIDRNAADPAWLATLTHKTPKIPIDAIEWLEKEDQYDPREQRYQLASLTRLAYRVMEVRVIQDDESPCKLIGTDECEHMMYKAVRCPRNEVNQAFSNADDLLTEERRATFGWNGDRIERLNMQALMSYDPCCKYTTLRPLRETPEDDDFWDFENQESDENTNNQEDDDLEGIGYEVED